MSNNDSNQVAANIPPEILRVKQRYSIIGNAPSLIGAIRRAMQVAPIDLSVLIIGESGSGKEFFPNIIHDYSSRKHNKYIAVNCGAIPEGTIDSELFGHEKGAFTGAISSRKGYFEEADGGTIFLDEVAELPLTTQARLLRVLESGEYIKVGSSEVQKTNIRVVAATNKDMLRAVSEGKFREDLYYRLSTVQINIPPLRERGRDVLMLVRKFSNDFAEKYGTPSVQFDDSAREVILGYRWPGNVRQLKNVIEQVSLFEAGNEVDADHIKKYLPPQYSTDNKPTVASAPTFNYTQEREMLFKLIFKMQHEIEKLSSRIDSLSKGGTTSGSHSHSLIKYSGAGSYKPTTPIKEVVDIEDGFADDETPYSEAAGVDAPESGSDVADSEAITLEDSERETIKKSLERNCGRRKKTAEELHISERTLYRKIKEYGLE